MASWPCWGQVIDDLEEEDLLRNYHEKIARSHLFKKHRRIMAFKRRTERALELYGKSRIGILTLTLQSESPWIKLKQALRKANRFLKKEFPDGWCWAAGLGKKKSLHIHFIVITPSDIAEGFDVSAYDEMRELKSCPAEWRVKRELARKVTTNECLRSLWKRFRDKLKDFGFGLWMDLTPLREEPKAISCYLAVNAEEVELSGCKPSGFRTVGFSGKFPKVPPPPPSERKIEHRERQARLVDLLGGKEELRKSYGTYWNNHLMRAMALTKIPTFGAAGEIHWSRYPDMIRHRLDEPRRDQESWNAIDLSMFTPPSLAA